MTRGDRSGWPAEEHAARELDQTCDRFEALWQAVPPGQPPRLEDFLPPPGKPFRPALFRELLAVELHYRGRCGLSEEPASYLTRFPDLTAIVARACAVTAGNSPPPSTAATLQTQQGPGLAQALAESGLLAASADARTDRAPHHKATPVRVAGYEVGELLGRGGMGAVYLARQVQVNRPVALKVILSGSGAGAAELARFRTEAEAVARLNHPGIVQLFEAGEGQTDSGVSAPYLAMEYCPGGSLAAKLADNPMPPRDAATLLVQVALAVHHAHEKGIVHRDLKPGNVLLDSKGNPKVADFGLAKLLDDAGQTQSGSLLGTPSYMAPEQASGDAKRVAPPADVYALGAILYECLTGQPPFRAATALDTLVRVTNEEPAPPRRLNARVPAELETIALKCLRKEPQKRYASAEALADDLDRWLAGRPIQARPTTATERMAKWARRNPGIAALTVTVALLLVTGTVVAWALAAWALNEAGRANNREQETKDALTELEEQSKKRREADAATLASQKKAREADHARLEQLLIRDRTTRLSVYGRTVNDAYASWKGDRADEALTLLEPLDADLRGWEWGHVQRLARRTTLRLEGHNKPITSLTWAGKSGLLITGDSSVIKVWDEGLRVVRTLEPPGNLKFYSVAGSASGKVALGRSDGVVQILDARRDWQPVSVCDGPRGAASALAWSKDGGRLVAAGESSVFDAVLSSGIVRESRTVILRGGRQAGPGCLSPDGTRAVVTEDSGACTVIDTADGVELLTWKLQDGRVSSVAFSPDGKRLASIDRTTLKVWDAAKGKELMTAKVGLLSPVCLAYSRDGKRIAAGCIGLKVWNAETAEELAWPNAKTDRIECVAFCPDGKRIATAGGKRLVLWDAEKGEQLRFSDDIEDLACSLAYSPDGKVIATGYGSGALTLHDPETGRRLATLRGHSGPVLSLLFRGDGKRLVSSGGDRSIRIWDIQEGKEIMCIQAGVIARPRVALSSDGTRVASTAAITNATSVWDTETGSRLLTLQNSTTGNTCLAFSADGSRIASGGRDRIIRIWDARKGQELLVLKGHTGQVSCLGFSPDGECLVSGGQDKVVNLWKIKTNGEPLSLRGHADPVVSVAFSPDSNRILSSDVATVKVWDARKGRELFSLKAQAGANCASFSPGGTRILSGGPNGILRVWDAETGGGVADEHAGAVLAVSASADGKLLASGGADRIVRLWAPATGAPLSSLAGHTEAVTCVAFAPDGVRLASGSADRSVRIWDRASGKTFRTLHHPAAVQAIAFHSSSPLLLTGLGDGTASVHDLTGGEKSMILKGHTGAVLAVAYSPDGSRIATGSADGSARLWDAATGEEVLRLKGHGAEVTTVNFLGRRLLTSALDGTLKLWDTSSGREVMTLKGHTAGITTATLSPDGQRIFSGGRDRTLRVWDAASGMATLVLPLSDPINALAVTPDGRQVVCGTEGKIVQLLGSEPWQAAPDRREGRRADEQKR